MKVFIWGMGSMGNRYSRVLDYLGVQWVWYDPMYAGLNAPDKTGVTHSIVSVPTSQHWPVFKLMDDSNWNILVEKPLTMDSFECGLFSSRKGYTVNNWCHVFDGEILKPHSHVIEYESQSFGPHSADGEQGQRFDLCQLYYLSKPGSPPKAALSPIWRASVDGRAITLNDIDWSYVRMVKAWLAGEENKLWTLKQGSEMSMEILST